MAFPIGDIIACVLSNVTSHDNAEEEKEAPVEPNSDWALVELGKDFDRTELEQSQIAANFSPVERERLEVLVDADLEPRKVLIRTGFSGNVKGKLSIARSRLQIGSSRFSVMSIELDEPLSKY
jgi:hypothetical protein